jgi:hypothetical protein
VRGEAASCPWSCGPHSSGPVYICRSIVRAAGVKSVSWANRWVPVVVVKIPVLINEPHDRTARVASPRSTRISCPTCQNGGKRTCTRRRWRRPTGLRGP